MKLFKAVGWNDQSLVRLHFAQKKYRVTKEETHTHIHILISLNIVQCEMGFEGIH